MITENTETEIYSDWYMVKQNIWINWFNLITLTRQLVEYKIKGIAPQKSRVFASACGSIYQVYMSIGKSKYKKFLDKEECKIVVTIGEKLSLGEKLKYKEIQDFMKFTNKWLEVSKMSQIDKAVENPGQAMLYNGVKK